MVWVVASRTRIVCSEPWRIAASVDSATDTTLRQFVTLVPSLRVGFSVRTDVCDWCESPVVSSHNSVRATRGAFVTGVLGGALVFPANLRTGILPGRCDDELLLCGCGGSTCVGYINNSVRRDDANWLRAADHGTGTGDQGTSSALVLPKTQSGPRSWAG